MHRRHTIIAAAFAAFLAGVAPAKADICAMYDALAKDDFIGAREALITHGGIFREQDCEADDESIQCVRNFTYEQAMARFDVVELAVIGKRIADSLARPCGLKVGPPELLEEPPKFLHYFPIHFADRSPINFHTVRHGEGVGLFFHYEYGM